MGLFDIFKRGEKVYLDDLAHAHQIATEALGVFDKVRADLNDAQNLLALVEQDSASEIDRLNGYIAHEAARIAEARATREKHAAVVSKIEALTSP